MNRPSLLVPVRHGESERVNRAALRRYDEHGRVFVPFSGSEAGPATDALERADGDGSVFLLERFEGDLFLTATAFVDGDHLVGDRLRLPLAGFAAAVATRRAAGTR